MHLTDNFRSGDVYLGTIVVALSVIVGAGMGNNLVQSKCFKKKPLYLGVLIASNLYYVCSTK